MFTFTRYQCRVTAFALLLLFVGALGLVGVCAVWCGPLHGTGLAMRPTAKKAPPHGCCTAKAAAKGRVNAPEKSKKADCCQHEKAAKWATVTGGSLAKLIKSTPAVLDVPPTVFAWLPARYSGDWAVWQTVRLVPPQHLPPKIPDIRVFLHSLTV